MNNGYEEFFINNKHYYSHRYVAEKYILGRPLLNTEVVHHIDENRSNNDPSNLMVFKTTADHSRFHKFKQLNLNIKLRKDGDVWVTEEIENVYSDNTLCPYCKKNYKNKRAVMCSECRSIFIESEFKERRSKNFKNPDNIAEELLPLVLNYPFTTIASKFGVTDNTIRKWCRKYDLPSTRSEIKEFYQTKKIPFTFVN